MPYKRKCVSGKVKYVAQVIWQGTRHQKLCSTKKQAVEWEARKKAELEFPTPTSCTLTFKELCTAYLDYIGPRVSPNTYNEKLKVLDELLPLWGELRLEQIT